MSQFIGLDIETAGTLQEYALQAYRVTTGQARISALSIGSPEAAIGRLEPTKEWIDRILASLRGKKVVGWNVCFDLSFLIASGCDVSGIEWYDAMLMWMHLIREPDEERGKPQSFSLETAMKTYFPEDAGFKEYTDFQNVSDGLLHRNKEDARFTAILANKFWEELAPSQRRAVTIETRSLIMIANTYIDGIKIDRPALTKLKSKLDADAKVAYTELLKHQNDIDNYNLGSPKQLGTLLFSTWGLTPTRFTDTNQPSTDKFALHDLAQIYPQAKLLRDYRESQNNSAKYADATLASIDYNGNDITRPQAKIFGTYTGRMTYYSKQGRGKNERPTGIALHQWKRGADFRNLISAPDGYQIVELDFAGQEFRWMAVASGDETMLALCAPGEDAHSYMGAKVSHQDYRELVKKVKAGDKEATNDRKLGKFCIAEGELVLTDKGLVPIEKVSLDHLVWDGVEWVAHTGSVYQGERQVMTYDGLTATPDHRVYLEDGTSCWFGHAAKEGYCIAQTERGGKEIRILADTLSGHYAPRKRYSGSSSMRLRKRRVAVPAKLVKREVFGLQKLCFKTLARIKRASSNQQCGCAKSSTPVCGDVPKMRKSEGFILSQLRWERDSVQICKCERGNYIHFNRPFSRNLSSGGHRPDRQRRSLRTRKFTFSHQIRESAQQAREQFYCNTWQEGSKKSCISCNTNYTSTDTVHRASDSESCVQRFKFGADFRAVGGTQLQTKRVYDITNAGPRHRYTVSGKLVANSNLSFQYRISAKAAAVKANVEYGIQASEGFIQGILNSYKDAYPGVPRYWFDAENKARAVGYAETFAGRRIQLQGPWTKARQWALGSTAINYPIQGTGGDQKYLALAVANTFLKDYDARFYYDLHDGMYFVVPEAKAKIVAVKLLNTFSNLPYKLAWGREFPIQFPVDCKIGPSWGQLKDLEA